MEYKTVHLCTNYPSIAKSRCYYILSVINIRLKGDVAKSPTSKSDKGKLIRDIFGILNIFIILNTLNILFLKIKTQIPLQIQ